MDKLPKLETAATIDPALLLENTNPFYIISPPYSLKSRHSHILFLLCHHLNTLGENAFIFPYPLELKSDQSWPYFCRFPVGDWQNSRLNVKILTQEISDEHFKSGMTPICVLPEIFDDPIHAPYIARYIIEEPGRIAEKYATPQQLTFSYNERLAEYIGSQAVLYIPVIEAPDSGLPERIKSLVVTLKEGVKAIPYEQQIELPYSSKIVFVDSDDGPHGDRWRRRPFRIRDNMMRERGDPSLWAARRKAASLFIIDWLLPPKFSQLVVAIKNVILNRG